MSKKNLFVVVGPAGKPAKFNDGYDAMFTSKTIAKDFRDIKNGGKFGSDESTDLFTVTYGPDHNKFGDGL